MAEPTNDDFLFRTIMRREWLRKTAFSETVRKINTAFKKNLIGTWVVKYYYSQLDKGDPLIFEPNSPLLVYSNQGKGTEEKEGKPKSLHNSLVMVDDEEYYKPDMLSKNGRFLVFPYNNGKYSGFFVEVVDVFQGKKRQNRSESDVYDVKSALVGNQDNLLMFNYDHNRTEESEYCYFVEIDYSTLSITNETDIEYSYTPYDTYPVSDKLDRKKFIVRSRGYVTKCRLGDNNKFIWGEHGRWPHAYFHYGQRLVGNKLQGFVWNGGLYSLKFVEIDLETEKEKETRVHIYLKGERELVGNLALTQSYCWSRNRFYGAFKKQEDAEYYFILMFDLETLKWTDIEIFFSGYPDLFIDENEVLTLRIRSWRERMAVLYRIALRTPEKLENLTRFVAVRHSSLYGNEKYINAARQIQIKD